MTTLHLSSLDLKKVKSIIKKMYPHATVWAYGSRVSGKCYEGSDLDLVVVDFGAPTHNIASLQDAFTESDIPILIDIRSWAQLPLSFQEEIRNQYIPILPDEKFQ